MSEITIRIENQSKHDVIGAYQAGRDNLGSESCALVVCLGMWALVNDKTALMFSDLTEG